MVPNTNELLPEPETPVKTVSRRFGISTLTSFRLFTRAPCTRIRSWLSATAVGGDCLAVVVAARSETGCSTLLIRWGAQGAMVAPELGGAGRREVVLRLCGTPGAALLDS